MKICHIFTWTVYIENPSRESEDIYLQNFRPKFHENPALPGKIDPIFESAASMPPKIKLTPQVRSYFYGTL